MNQELAQVIKIYSTGAHQELSNYLIGKSKDTLIGILVDLLTIFCKKLGNENREMGEKIKR